MPILVLGLKFKPRNGPHKKSKTHTHTQKNLFKTKQEGRNEVRLTQGKCRTLNAQLERKRKVGREREREIRKKVKSENCSVADQ
jgi:hypothetical protein